MTLCKKMKIATRYSIEAAFQITEGAQIILTSISTREPSPCVKGDHIVIQSLSGRIEHTKVGAIEFALKPGGVEFYGLALDGEEIFELVDFTGGFFDIDYQ